MLDKGKLLKPIKTLFIMASVFLSPTISEAAIIINEIAWMGSAASANHEWIELHNTNSEAIDVTGWTLRDGMNLNINLSGIIQGGAYVVLERTSDESAPGTAFLIYTGALVNTGATLTLRNAEGAIVDQVAGGENWQNVGGDNTTKETAQYTQAGWVTDLPTPGAPNNTGRINSSSNSSGSNQVAAANPRSVASNSRSNTVSLTIPNTTLQLRVDGQSMAYVNQSLRFSGLATGVAPRIIDSLRYNWNFGDTNTATGKEVVYSFNYPGTYVVTLRAGYARHDQVVRHEITILPVNFSLTRNEQGDIQLHNDAPYDVDISGYRLVGIETLVLPPHSIMLPRSTITIPKSRLKSDPNTLVALYDVYGNLVASTFKPLAQGGVSDGNSAVLLSSNRISPGTLPVATRSTNQDQLNFAFADNLDSDDLPVSETVLSSREGEINDDEEDGSARLIPSSARSVTSAEPTPRYWVFGALILLLVGAAYGLQKRRPKLSDRQ